MATVIHIKKGDTATRLRRKIKALPMGDAKKGVKGIISYNDKVLQAMELIEGLNANTDNETKQFEQQFFEGKLLKGKFDAKKFTGKIKSNAFGDALHFQKMIRDEWE